MPRLIKKADPSGPAQLILICSILFYSLLLTFAPSRPVWTTQSVQRLESLLLSLMVLVSLLVLVSL